MPPIGVLCPVKQTRGRDIMAGFDHIAITVSDLDRSLAFYEKYFGLRLARRDQPHSGELVESMTGIVGGELLAAFATDGELTLEFIQFTRGQSGRTEGLAANEVGSPHLGFSVPDVRAAYAAMSADGVRFLAPPIVSPRRATWSVMLTDPDGIAIELREGPALPPEAKGAAGAPKDT